MPHNWIYNTKFKANIKKNIGVVQKNKFSIFFVEKFSNYDLEENNSSYSFNIGTWYFYSGARPCDRYKNSHTRTQTFSCFRQY